MIYVFDIDGVVCETKEGDYSKSVPLPKRIKRINKLYDDGHTVIFNTSRGYVTQTNWQQVTENQFKKWGIKYHELLFTKPYGQFYVDDHGMSDLDFFHDK